MMHSQQIFQSEILQRSILSLRSAVREMKRVRGSLYRGKKRFETVIDDLSAETGRLQIESRWCTLDDEMDFGIYITRMDHYFQVLALQPDRQKMLALIFEMQTRIETASITGKLPEF